MSRRARPAIFCCGSLIVLSVFACSVGIIRAESPAPAEAAAGEAAPPAATDAAIAGWIHNLDADQFETREEATAALAKAGIPAIKPLADAAEHGTPEVVMRAMNVLKEYLHARDSATQLAALEVLEKLAASDNKSLAAQAAAVLKPDPPPQRFGRWQRGAGIGPNVIIQPGVRIQFQAMAAGGGNRDIHVQENGRVIHITENAQQGITVTVTERIDGKDKTTTYQAADVAELERKHPEGFAIYSKYTMNRRGGMGKGAVWINAPVFAPPPGFVNPQPANPPAPADRVAADREINTRVTEAQKHLQETARHVRDLVQAGTLTDEAAKRLLDEIDSAARDLADAQLQLQK